MRKQITLALSLLSFAAIADNSVNGNMVTHTGMTNNGINGNRTWARADPVQTNANRSVSDSLSTSRANLSSSNSIENGNVTIQGDKHDYSEMVPSMGAPQIQPTANCVVTGSGALSLAGGGFAIGGGGIDKGCAQREQVRIAIVGGNWKTRQMADSVMQNWLYAIQLEQRAAMTDGSDSETLDVFSMTDY